MVFRRSRSLSLGVRVSSGNAESRVAEGHGTRWGSRSQSPLRNTARPAAKGSQSTAGLRRAPVEIGLSRVEDAAKTRESGADGTPLHSRVTNPRLRSAAAAAALAAVAERRQAELASKSPTPKAARPKAESRPLADAATAASASKPTTTHAAVQNTVHNSTAAAPPAMAMQRTDAQSRLGGSLPKPNAAAAVPPPRPGRFISDINASATTSEASSAEATPPAFACAVTPACAPTYAPALPPASARPNALTREPAQPAAHTPQALLRLSSKQHQKQTPSMSQRQRLRPSKRINQHQRRPPQHIQQRHHQQHRQRKHRQQRRDWHRQQRQELRRCRQPNKR
eukprot:387708-Pleurochrysis_carterae.AAC.1